MVCACFMAFLISTSIQLSKPDVFSSVYRRLDSVQFTNTTSEVLSLFGRCTGEILPCALACSNDPTCSSFNTNTTLHICTKNIGDIYTFGQGTLQPSIESYYVGKIQQYVTDGDWILVYRGQAENNISTYSMYSNTSEVMDNELTQLNLAAISKSGDVKSSHYRSRWLNQWPSNISQVKFELYDHGQTVLTLLFNGTGSNSTNWFSHSRLIQSPYTDLTWPPVMFSLTAYPIGKRRFCITNATNIFDCNQKSWLLVEEMLDTSCLWTSSSTKTFPRFLYSKTNTYTAFNTQTQGLANVLGIFIKF